MSDIKQLEPTRIWEHFSDLCQIPRPSGQEEQVRDHIVALAERLSLESYVDEVGNLIVRKPATAGMENRTGVILQSHLDMVPQKNADTDHNFSRDPIKAYIDGEWVTAAGTTLGADNGMGIAATLAILQATDIPHGPVEALFTIDEERSMVGAEALKSNVLQGKILINLDTEEEGEVYVGCAGGVDVLADATYTEETPAADMQWRKLTIKGLKGGHSGCDIHLQRGNASKLMIRMLKQMQTLGVRIVSFEGGNLSNAIPRECFATVAIPADQSDVFDGLFDKMAAVFGNELQAVEPGLIMLAEETEAKAQFMAEQDQLRWLDTLDACPHGVDRMSDSVPGVVETSNNLAIVTIADGKIHAACFARSLIDSATENMGHRLCGLFRMAGAEARMVGMFPGWQPDVSSAMLVTMKETHETLFGNAPEVKVIHAGLECGILGATYPEWDMVSIGPTIVFPHSPDEKVHIESVSRFWQWLQAALGAVPEAA